jgi:hypothetical protein
MAFATSLAVVLRVWRFRFCISAVNRKRSCVVAGRPWETTPSLVVAGVGDVGGDVSDGRG